jgi:hypothetical protein
MHKDTVCMDSKEIYSLLQFSNWYTQKHCQNVLHVWLWWHVYKIQLWHNNKDANPQKRGEYTNLMINKIDDDNIVRWVLSTDKASFYINGNISLTSVESGGAKQKKLWTPWKQTRGVDFCMIMWKNLSFAANIIKKTISLYMLELFAFPDWRH